MFSVSRPGEVTEVPTFLPAECDKLSMLVNMYLSMVGLTWYVRWLGGSKRYGYSSCQFSERDSMVRSFVTNATEQGWKVIVENRGDSFDVTVSAERHNTSELPPHPSLFYIPPAGKSTSYDGLLPATISPDDVNRYASLVLLTHTVRGIPPGYRSLIFENRGYDSEEHFLKTNVEGAQMLQTFKQVIEQKGWKMSIIVTNWNVVIKVGEK